jgi:hypothetical protein
LLYGVELISSSIARISSSRPVIPVQIRRE